MTSHHPELEWYLTKERMKMLGSEYGHPPHDNGPSWPYLLIIALIIVWVCYNQAFGNIPRLPGSNQIDQLEAAGTLLRIIDSALFSWAARIFAGLLILNAGNSLKNQAFGIAFLSIIGAIVVGTAPMWVKNIFDMGGGTLFSIIFPWCGHYV